MKASKMHLNQPQIYIRRRRRALLLVVFLLVFGSLGGTAVYHHYLQAEALRAEQQEALSKRQSDWDALSQQVRQEMQAYDGDVGMVIKDLQTGWELTYQADRLFPAASVVKLPIMASCLQAVQTGKLNLDERLAVNASDQVAGGGPCWTKSPGTTYSIVELLEHMITESDNTATNVLIKHLGMANLNQSFQAFGLHQTSLTRKMMDFRARARGFENYTSAADTSDLLEKLYRQQVLNPQLSGLSIDILKHQKYRDRIPRKLPSDVQVAHKTGLENFICHDAGIVFTPKGDYLICVLTHGKAPYGVSKRLIGNLALDTYQYVMQAEPVLGPTVSDLSQLLFSVSDLHGVKSWDAARSKELI